jgi:hypothetical protein
MLKSTLIHNFCDTISEQQLNVQYTRTQHNIRQLHRHSRAL